MSLFDSSKIIFTGSHFVICDISDKLRKHKNFPHGSDAINPNTGKRDVRGSYQKVRDRKIAKVLVHQTAGGYHPAEDQLLNTNSFFITDPTWKKNPKFGQPKQPEWLWTGMGRGWPGFAYTFFVPYAPETCNGRFIIYKCNDLELVTWHTGDGQNESGVGLAFQGYFLSEPDITHPMKGQDGHPSEEQMGILPAFWYEYAIPNLGATDLSGHFEHGKPTCPGDDLREKVQEIRGY